MLQTMRPPLVCHGHTRPVPELNFSHNTPDGYFLVSACKDGKAMLRRGESGDWIGTFEGHGSACVWSCALNHPALLAATASADFTCKLWNAISGEELQCWHHPHIVRGVHFSTDSNKLATACQDKAVRIFDVSNPAADATIFPTLRDSVRAAKFIDNDKSILVSYQSGAGMDVIDARSGTKVQNLETPGPVTSFNISYDGRTFTTACGNEVGVYEAVTRERKHLVKTQQQVESASVCLEKGLLVVGGKDMWAHMLSYPAAEPLMVHKGHHGPVWCTQFAHDGESFATASEDGTIRIWHSGNRDVPA